MNAATNVQIGSSNTTAFGTTGTFTGGDSISVSSYTTFGTSPVDLGDAGRQVIIQVIDIPTNTFLLVSSQ